LDTPSYVRDKLMHRVWVCFRI